MEAEGPEPRRGGGGREEMAAAAVEERRRKLQEYLAAKGRLKPANPKPYLKDNSRQKNPAPSKAQPIVGSRKNVAPSRAQSASTREGKGSGPASKVLSNKPLLHREPNNVPAQLPRNMAPVLPLPSKPPARKHPEKLICKNSSARPRLTRTREPGKQQLATTSGMSKGLSDVSKAEQDKENSLGQPQKREASQFSLQTKSQVGSKPPVKNGKQAVRSNTLSGNHRAAVAQVKPKAPLGVPQRQLSVARTSPPLGRPSGLSRPSARGPRPRLIRQPAAGQFVPRRPPANKEGTVSSSRRGLGLLQRGQCRPQERTPPGRSLQRKRKATTERRHSTAPGATKQKIDLGNKRFRQAPRPPEPKGKASKPDSGVCGRDAPRAKQPAAEAGQEPKTPGTQDRRKMLEEWLASKGKQYKRPPMTFPVKRKPPPKEEAAQDRSFWNCMEEEMEQQKVAQQIASTLAECTMLADEGVSSEELLAILSRIPEAEKFAQFWVCKAKLLARHGPFDAAKLYRAATCAGAVPLQQLRDALVDTLKHSGQAWATPSKEQAQSTGPGLACQPLWAVKLQVASLPRAKEPSARPDLKLLTPVRRSLRIGRASARYPDMLRDHDPVVSSLDELTAAEGSCRFFFRKNEALPEAEMEGFLPRTSAPTSPAPALRRPLFC